MAYTKKNTKSGRVFKSASKSKRATKVATARLRVPKVAPSVKKYVNSQLDRKIPDKTFTMIHNYYTNSGITNADLYPTLGYNNSKYGINVPQCLCRLAEDDGSLAVTLDQHFSKGVRLKSIRVSGELSLPSDWFLKGTGYSYLVAHVYIFCRKPSRHFQMGLSASDMFVKKNEVDATTGALADGKDNNIQGTADNFSGAWEDSTNRWNSQRYKLLAHKKIMLTGGTSNITNEEVLGNSLPLGWGTGSHGASMPQHMRKKFSCNLKCPKYLRWDMNQFHNIDVDQNTAPDFQPMIAIGYQREGGVDSTDTMLHARYTVDVRVEPPPGLA